MLIGLGIIGAIFDDDSSGSSGGGSGRSLKPSFENGVLIVSDVHVGMTFDELPDRWVPEYEEYENGDISIITNRYSNYSYSIYPVLIEYEGIEFEASLEFIDRTLTSDERYALPLARAIRCVSVEQKIPSKKVNR